MPDGQQSAKRERKKFIQAVKDHEAKKSSFFEIASLI